MASPLDGGQRQRRTSVRDVAQWLSEAASPRPFGELHRLLPVAAAVAVLTVVMLIFVYWAVVAVLSGFRAPNQQSLTSLLTAAISTTALIGAALGAVYAFRKQVLAERDGARADQQVFSDRYVKAAELLAHERPSARLAAMHSLANLADDWVQGRFSCAMALSSYLRLPPPVSESGTEEVGEREVRRTAWKIVRTRLEDPAIPTSWHDQDLDFSGGRFDNVDLDSTVLRGTKMQFRNCIFRDGEIRLRGVSIADSSLIDFTGSSFTNVTILLQGMSMSDASQVVFDAATMSDCKLLMDHMSIGRECEVSFRRVEASGTDFLFDSAGLAYWFQDRFSEVVGEVDFSESRLKSCRVPMHNYKLTGRLVFHEAETDEVQISIPKELRGHPYVNVDVTPVGPTSVYIGPGCIDGGDLRIRPRGGRPHTLDVDFCDYDIAGGEVFVTALAPVWSSFRLDAARPRRGRFVQFGSFPESARVDIDRGLESVGDEDGDYDD